jgi:hypothetical protein
MATIIEFTNRRRALASDVVGQGHRPQSRRYDGVNLGQRHATYSLNRLPIMQKQGSLRENGELFRFVAEWLFPAPARGGVHPRRS